MYLAPVCINCMCKPKDFKNGVAFFIPSGAIQNKRKESFLKNLDKYNKGKNSVADRYETQILFN